MNAATDVIANVQRPLAGAVGLLEVPVEVAHRTGQRALVAFDEFQDVLSVPGLDGLLRSHIQHHADRVTYVFSGSEPSLLSSLFADRARPLYGQAKPMRLGPIAPELLAGSIAEKFEATGRTAGEGGQAVAQFAAGHPQRTREVRTTRTAQHVARSCPARRAGN
jgi:hypothetical protein